MNDDELKRELNGLTPEPGPGYWEQIDATLAGVEAERNDGVVSLASRQQRRLNGRGGRGSGLFLAVAASIVAMLAVGGFAVLRNNPTTLDVATGGGEGDSASQPDDAAASAAADSDAPGEPPGDVDAAGGSADPADASEADASGVAVDAGTVGGESASGGEVSTAPIAATYCFSEADTELVPGELGARLVVRSDGTAVAVERLVRPDGEVFVTEATGYVLDDDERTFAMKAVLGDGQLHTRVWRVTTTGLSTDIESFIPSSSCDTVDRFLDGVAMPAAVVSEPERIDPVLDAGFHCWSGDQMIDEFYRLTVGNDGVAAVEVYTTDRSVSPVMTSMASGAGTFATESEIALNLEWWSPEGFSTDSVVYTISDGRLRPTVYPDFEAEPVACDLLDQWRFPGEGMDVFRTEEVKFERGTTGATVEGGFIRGEVVVYELEADRGQTMTVSVSSAEDNAGIAIHTPDGFAILDNEEGSGSGSVVLPETGVYQVVVSSIRGNVSYTLDIEIL